MPTLKYKVNRIVSINSPYWTKLSNDCISAQIAYNEICRITQ